VRLGVFSENPQKQLDAKELTSLELVCQKVNKSGAGVQVYRTLKSRN